VSPTRRKRKAEVQHATSADPIRNFTLSVDERIRALTIGVPAYSARKRKIEDQEESCVNALLDLHETLTAEGKVDHEIEHALTTAAKAFDLAKLNALVATHNRYYPIEANLPMNRGGSYLVYGRVWEPEAPYTAERLVSRALQLLRDREPNDGA
jgi:hypothetical protein